MNTTAVRKAARPSTHSGVVSTPFRDIFGFFALSAGLSAGLFSLVGFLSHFGTGLSAGVQTFLGLG